MKGSSPVRRPPPTRLERQAQRWALHMNDDPERHRPGLERWIGGSDERLQAYNKVANAMRWQTWSADHHYETRERATRPVHRASPRHTAWAVVAVIIGLTAAAIGVTHLLRVGPQHHAAISVASLDAPSTVARAVHLSDGSQVILAPGAHVDVRIGSDTRRIVLVRGAAEFRVSHAAQWPFIVSAGGGTVTAKGTVFTVSLAEKVAVQLLRGAIDVAPPLTAGPREPVRHLVAGQSTVFVAARDISRRVRVSAPSPAPEMTQMKNYDDVTVGEVLAETNRLSATQVVVSDPSIASRKVVMQLHVGDAEDVAEGLAGWFDL